MDANDKARRDKFYQDRALRMGADAIDTMIKGFTYIIENLEREKRHYEECAEPNRKIDALSTAVRTASSQHNTGCDAGVNAAVAIAQAFHEEEKD